MKREDCCSNCRHYYAYGEVAHIFDYEAVEPSKWMTSYVKYPIAKRGEYGRRYDVPSDKPPYGRRVCKKCLKKVEKEGKGE